MSMELILVLGPCKSILMFININMCKWNNMVLIMAYSKIKIKVLVITYKDFISCLYTVTTFLISAYW